MKIGGFLKQSFIDYPGKLACIIFTSGCNFRCFYCHNPQLVLPEYINAGSLVPVNDIFFYINKNIQLLDAVVITGGEPTIHKNLPGFIKKIQSYGLSIKLDTNGTNPDMLELLMKENMLDYIAMDIKAPLVLSKYKKIVGRNFTEEQLKKVKKSLSIIHASNISFEFRTTLCKQEHSFQDILEMSGTVKDNYYLQIIRDEQTIKPNISSEKYTVKELVDFVCKNKLNHVMVRNSME